MENTVTEDKNAGLDIGILAIALVAVWALASGKLGGLIPGATPRVIDGGTFTPGTDPSTQPGKQPVTDPPALLRELISEIPPPNVPTYYLGGGIEYAKLAAPIDVGDGFKQWGVTTQGSPVVSMKPPEQYEEWEWFM